MILIQTPSNRRPNDLLCMAVELRKCLFHCAFPSRNLGAFLILSSRAYFLPLEPENTKTKLFTLKVGYFKPGRMRYCVVRLMANFSEYADPNEANRFSRLALVFQKI